MMNGVLKMQLINDGQVNIGEGKTALLFYIPEHCMGCKRAIKILQDKPLTNWTIFLVDSEAEANKPLINQYNVSMAPTIITFENGEQKDFIAGLKAFIDKKDIFDD